MTDDDAARTLAMIDACVKYQDGRMQCFGYKVADVAFWLWTGDNHQPWMSLKEDRVAGSAG